MRRWTFVLGLLLLAGIAWAEQPQPVVRLCVDPDWEPYEKLTPDGRHVGIAADLLQHIAQAAGVRIEIVPTRDWEQSLEYARQGTCDGLSFLNRTTARDEWLAFTKPYFTDPNVIITRREHEYVPDLARLKDARIALPRGTSIEERVRREYPNLTVIAVDSEAEAFRLVEERQADLTLRSLTMAAYIIRKEGWFNLKISGEVPAYANQLRIGIRRPLLHVRDILDTGISAITPDKVETAVNRHIAINVAYRVDYGLVTKIAGTFLALLLLFGIWGRRERRHKKTLSLINTELVEEMQRRKESEELLRAREYRMHLILETAHEGIAVTQGGRIVYFNRALPRLFGYTAEELLALPSFAPLVHPEDLTLATEKHRQHMEGETAEQRYPLRLVRKDGSAFWAELSGVFLQWNGHPATLNFVTDISDRKAQEEHIRHQATHDALTGLANRSFFLDLLEQEVEWSRKEGKKLGVLFVDLNRFKPVNDTYGHEVGDQLLKAFSLRLVGVVQSIDTVARMGGDEFLLLLPNIPHRTSAEQVAAKIRHAMKQPFSIGGHDIMLSAGVGIAIFPDDGTETAQVLQAADQAMYADKQRHTTPL
jgi:diguanylate cyclase (GGDEF)-like protein/PAS domain S-box-containing protein